MQGCIFKVTGAIPYIANELLDLKTNKDQTVIHIQVTNVAPLIHAHAPTQQPFWVMLTPPLNKANDTILFVAYIANIEANSQYTLSENVPLDSERHFGDNITKRVMTVDN